MLSTNFARTFVALLASFGLLALAGCDAANFETDEPADQTQRTDQTEPADRTDPADPMEPAPAETTDDDEAVLGEMEEPMAEERGFEESLQEIQSATQDIRMEVERQAIEAGEDVDDALRDFDERVQEFEQDLREQYQDLSDETQPQMEPIDDPIMPGEGDDRDAY